MTDDEKMAEEFVGREHYVCRWDMEQTDLEEIAKEAFLAGLEAGRPKWHKVADGDLPKDCEDGTRTSEHVWVRFKSGNMGVCYYDWDLLGWFANGYPEQLKDILVWCEIPKFEE